MIPTRPLIRDSAGDFSSTCPARVGLKELDKIHRTLPAFQTDNEDLEVLQDEDGLGVRDEQTDSFIIDDLR